MTLPCLPFVVLLIYRQEQAAAQGVRGAGGRYCDGYPAVASAGRRMVEIELQGDRRCGLMDRRCRLILLALPGLIIAGIIACLPASAYQTPGRRFGDEYTRSVQGGADDACAGHSPLRLFW